MERFDIIDECDPGSGGPGGPANGPFAVPGAAGTMRYSDRRLCQRCLRTAAPIHPVQEPIVPEPLPPRFDEVFSSIADVNGWMTRAQAERLWQRSAELDPGSRIVEIGSYHGRSAIVLATAAADGVEITAIDPHGGTDRGPWEYEGDFDEGQRDHEIFMRNLERALVRDRVVHVRKLSQDALDDVAGGVQLLYIDGAHRFRPALADLMQWSPKVAKGGVMLIHDSFSSLGLTLAMAVALFWSDEFRYEGRSGSMAQYRREPVPRSERRANAAAQLAQLPWFVWNQGVKVLIRLGVLPVSRIPY